MLGNFIVWTNSDSRRLVLSPFMVRIVKDMSPNNLVTVLDTLARNECRSLDTLEVVCGLLAGSRSLLTLTKYHLILKCLATLNYRYT